MRRLLKLILISIPVWFLVLSVVIVVALKWIPINYTPLMAKRAFEYRDDENYCKHHKWTPIENVSEAYLKAVIAAEDAGYFSHNGFKTAEIQYELERFMKGEKDIRGCSTISQQTAKNVFTFGTPTWFRKGLEAYYTFLIEKIWGKRRILEVYANIAEMGKGIYGIQAAAEYYFHTNAKHLTMADASSLAVCLPCPQKRTPDSVNTHFAKRRNQIAKDASITKLQF